MIAVDDLVRLCPPPVDPPPVAEWDGVESVLGFRLPDDYKRLCDLYGPGDFGDFIGVRHPLGSTDWISLTGPMAAIVGQQLAVDRANGWPVPYDPRHLFAIGVTGNGEYVFWVTEPQDDPDRWRIAVNEPRGPSWFSFDGGLVRFLTAVLDGRTRVPLFPDMLTEQGSCFTSSPALRPGGQPISVVTVTARSTRTRDTDAIRAWGRAHGYDVPLHSRLPAQLRTDWERAHPDE
ncbi:SMI1/KNR4 family protein [Streptomyces sp. NPDC056257]|uniref:SMI1/KNR4 family protein n=1 Tax=Streptomyces sp. NPDC056257 TaxID=3345765 RepID=UPI0035DEFCBD